MRMITECGLKSSSQLDQTSADGPGSGGDGSGKCKTLHSPRLHAWHSFARLPRTRRWT
jgi:hypothetical protein